MCAHPIEVQNANPQVSVEAGWHGMDVELTVKSDSGGDGHLNRVVEWEEVGASFEHTGSLIGFQVPAPRNVPVQAANRVEPDRHRSPQELILAAHDKQPGGGGGTWSVDQLDVLVCLRCGMCHPRVIPRSGYRVTRRIISGPGQAVQLEVRKTPQACILKKYEAQAGPSDNIAPTTAPVRIPDWRSEEPRDHERAMQITAHDENSLTNLLFSEIHRHDRLPAFLGTITWRNRATFPFMIRDVTLHQQVGLSEFGKPDAVIIIVDADGRFHVLVVESKLKTYIESCGHNLPLRRFNNNSTRSSTTSCPFATGLYARCGHSTRPLGTSRSKTTSQPLRTRRIS